MSNLGNADIAKFPDESRIWIFTSNRRISGMEQAEISDAVQDFTGEWAAHGNALLAAHSWLNDYQLAIVLDQRQAGASGCSIDAQTRFMRGLGEERNIDWFDRMHLIINDQNEIKRVSFFDIGNFPEAELYDNLYQQLKDVRENWPVPLKSSRYAHLIR